MKYFRTQRSYDAAYEGEEIKQTFLECRAKEKFHRYRFTSYVRPDYSQSLNSVRVHHTATHKWYLFEHYDNTRWEKTSEHKFIRKEGRFGVMVNMDFPISVARVHPAQRYQLMERKSTDQHSETVHVGR